MSDKSKFPYLHGFSKTEQDRLRTQARFAEHTIYQDIDFSAVEKIIEVGCGVGAQTEILLRRFPDLNVHGVDLNEKQIQSAKDFLKTLSYAKGRYTIEKQNAQDMDFESNIFDGAFLCWVLEHVPEPTKVLSEVRRVLKPGSKFFITEVLNSSFFLEPYSPNVWKYWMSYNDFQYDNAGDPFIGAKLGNLLLSTGFKDVETKVKTWHLDNRDPKQRKDTIEFWSDLLLSGSDILIEKEIVSKELVDNMRIDLKRISKDPDAVFFYSFVQASGTVY